MASHRHRRHQYQAVSPRVPLALQTVFVDSNIGKEIHVAPESNVGSKIFGKWGIKRSFFGKSKRSSKNSVDTDLTELLDSDSTLSHYDTGTILEVTTVENGFSSNGPKTPGTKQSKTTSTKQPKTVNQQPKTAKQQPKTAKPQPKTAKSQPKTAKPQHKTAKPQPKTAEVSGGKNDDRSLGEGKTYLSPQAYLDTILEARGYSTRRVNTLETAYYNKPTVLQKASYHPFVIRVARDAKHVIFREIMESGISPNPCNAHGESLIHTVCRSCKPEALQILLDAGSSVQVCDDYGRTPLHDACWRANTCFETVEKIIRKDLNLFFMADSRGFLPLSYVPRAQWIRWLNFIDAKKDTWWKPKKEHLLDLPPDSRPIPDPKHALSAELAAMVAAGKLTPNEALYLNHCNNLSAESSDDSEYDSEYDSEDESEYDSEYDTEDDSGSEPFSGSEYEDGESVSSGEYSVADILLGPKQ